MPKIPSSEPTKGLPISEPDIKTHDVDILIVGGGMGACGVAYEAVKWGDPHGLKILLCDKAALERSGAVAQGLSAINTYLGDNTADDYVRMVRNDLMGIVREDLIYDVGRHVDDSVLLFEDWGLPIWIKDGDQNLNGAVAKEKGMSLRKGNKPVRSGRWQIMINGESYKCIVAEAAKNALGQDRIMERMFIVKLLLDDKEPNRIAGAVGFSVRDNCVHIFKANAIMVGAGGAVNIYRPRSMGEGMGRAWYPVWNAGSTYALCAQVGAEMTMMENRFVPARFKDGYGPVGAWFLLFKAKATNAKGEDYCVTNDKMLDPYRKLGYASGNVIPTCLRNHMMIREMREGLGPIFMDTATALNKTFDKIDGEPIEEDQKEHKKKDLESEAWEDFLDMCVGQANLWACSNTLPEERGSEIMPTEPYLLGSHSGCCGIWVSGPDEDWVPDEYKIKAKNGKVYNRMTTVEGLFTCADGVGASGHKFSSGSHAEGRIAGKQMVRWCVDHPDFQPTIKQTDEELREEIYKPFRNYEAGKAGSTDPTVNPAYIAPRNFMMRLIKATDEYGGGVATYYMTSGHMLETGFHLLELLEEDSAKLCARDLHELLRAWENYHRLWTVRLHMQHIAFREETRYPGFYYRSDFKGIYDDKWKCFVNSKYDPIANTTTIFKRPYIQIIPDAEKK